MRNTKPPECECHTADEHARGQRVADCMGKMMETAQQFHLTNDEMMGIAACLAALAADELGGRARNVMRLVSLMMEAPAMHDDEPTQGGADA